MRTELLRQKSDAQTGQRRIYPMRRGIENQLIVDPYVHRPFFIIELPDILNAGWVTPGCVDRQPLKAGISATGGPGR